MPLIIRTANTLDLPGILALYAQPALDHDDVLLLHHAEHRFRQMQTYPDYRLYVATQDNSIIGTFALLIVENLIHQGKPSGIVEAVAVDPEFQNQGVGKRMMEFAMERCRERGCYKLTLSAQLDRDRAHHFYESLGFQKHGYSFVMDLGVPDVAPGPWVQQPAS
jgi:ribosomal protein S18 acetylase RimI-like enzyme